MAKGRKQYKTLDNRRSDYHRMIANGSREAKVDIRMSSGGYRCPGSNKK